MLAQDGFCTSSIPFQDIPLILLCSTAIEPPLKWVHTLSPSLAKYYKRVSEGETVEYYCPLCLKARLWDPSAQISIKKKGVY